MNLIADYEAVSAALNLIDEDHAAMLFLLKNHAGEWVGVTLPVAELARLRDRLDQLISATP